MGKKEYNPTRIYDAKGKKVATIKSQADEDIESEVGFVIFGYLVMYAPILGLSYIVTATMSSLGVHTLFCVIAFGALTYAMHKVVNLNELIQRIYYVFAALSVGAALTLGLFLWWKDAIWALGIGAITTYGLFKLVTYLGTSFGKEKSHDEDNSFMSRLTGDD